MAVTVKLKNLRIAPRKVRLVADLIRKKRVQEAQTVLNFTIKKAAKPLLKLLNSAIANAKQNFQMNPVDLYISKITVDEGPKYKRWMPRARGVASEIQKKTSHITLVLDEINSGSVKAVKKEKETTKEKNSKEKVSIIREEGKTLKEVKKEIGLKEEEKSEQKKDDKIKKEPLKVQKTKGVKRFFRRKAF